MLVMGKAFKSGCSKCFRALSTDIRSKMISLLRDGKERSVTEIFSFFKLTQPTISYHLSSLEKAGLLVSRHDGRFVFYRLNSRCPYDNDRCILR